IFSGYVLSANILVPRLVSLDLGFTSVLLTSGSLIWPFTTQISDMVNEIYGRRKALLSVVLAYVLNVMFILFLYTAAFAPAVWSSEKEAFWEEYFLPSARIFLASSASFVVCSAVD